MEGVPGRARASGIRSTGIVNPGTPRVRDPSKIDGEARPTATALDEDRAIERCLGGDAEAFGGLVERYQDRIFNACVRILDDREAAREAAQEAFLRAFERLRSFRRGARFSTWLFAIAINQCRSELRRRKTKKHKRPLSLDAARSDEDGGRWEPPADGPDPSDRMLREERGRRVAREVAALPEQFREPVVLRDVEGLSYEEIADVMGVPVGTVRSRIHRGRLLLRDRLSDLAGEV
jgi:RNA polymerase sigma-70 factor (ECF subfamily)